MVDRLTPPPFIRSNSFNLLEPITVILPGGANVQFIPGGTQEVLHIELLFNAGRWFEKQPGISHFASNLLSKGSKTKDSFQIAQVFDQYGAHVEISPGFDVVSVSLYTLVKNVEPVLQLFHEIIVAPTFPERELKQDKSIFLQNLKVNNEKTSFLASKLIRKKIFGDKHPYGKDLEETDVLPIQVEPLISFHKKFFSETQIIVSGKINETVQKLIVETFSNFENVKPISQPVINFDSNASETYLEKEGSMQTSIRLGKKSVLRSHPNYFDVVFLNHILGGYFGSRLMKNIREEKGLSYGIYSSLHPLKQDSYLVVGADVNKDNRELAIQEIKNEMTTLCSENIKLAEIETARYHFIGSLQSEMSTPFAHAEKIKNILQNNLPRDYYQQMINRISTISDNELRITAQKYFAPESFIAVCVG